MIRSIRPPDLMRLLGFTRRAVPNEALAWHNLQREPDSALPARAFLQQWLSLEENRHTWVSVRRHRLTGLISARNRSGHSAWEIDRLLLDPDGDYETDCLALLDHVGAVGGDAGMEKLFLRLPVGSSLVEVARQAGFLPYKVETLYRRDTPVNGYRAAAKGLSLRMRPRAGRDEQALFRLYTSAMPRPIQHHEGITLSEWRDARERDPEARRKKDYVLERDGRIAAWVHAVAQGRGGQFFLLVDPESEELMPDLLRYALALLEGRNPVLTLVPERQLRLQRLLEEHGFAALGEYCTLVKHMTVRVRQLQFVPVRA
jgi:hypothetical protein